MSDEDKKLDKNLSSTIDDLLSSIPDDTAVENVWEEKPVSPAEFISGKEFLNDFKGTIWPWVRQDLDIIFSGPNYDPICNLYLNSSGIGSGKSTMSSVLYSYLVYRLLCMRSPSNYFNLRDSVIAFMNMAPRAEQAKGIVFEKFSKTVKEIPWFKERKFFPDPKIESVLKFPKSIHVVPGNSSEKFPLGADLYGGIIDEACFYATPSKDPCEEIFYALDERRESRFGVNGLIVMISSAGSETCYMEKTLAAVEARRIEQGLGPNDIVEWNKLKVFAKRRPIWECRPKKTFYPSGKTFHYSVKRETATGVMISYDLDIPVELEERFKLQPEQSLRNLASIPTMTINPYIVEWERVLNNCNKARTDPFPDPDGPISPVEVFRGLPDDFRGQDGVQYFCHVDLATGGSDGKGDACGLAIGHKGSGRMVGDISTQTSVLDLSIRFKAGPTKEIQLPEVFQFIVDMQTKRNFKFAKITFDGFQSVFIIQFLNSFGILAERDPVTKKDYDTMKDQLYNGALDYFYDTNLFRELKYLEDAGAMRPNHAINMHDDESDCVAKVCSAVCEGMPVEEVVRKRWKGGSTGTSLTGGTGTNQLNTQRYDPYSNPWNRGR